MANGMAGVLKAASGAPSRAITISAGRALVSRVGRPVVAALEHPPLGDPAVERKGPAAASGRPRRVAPLGKPSLDPGPAIVRTSSFGSSWQQYLVQNTHPFLW
jgi:hypothetical protein